MNAPRGQPEKATVPFLSEAPPDERRSAYYTAPVNSKLTTIRWRPVMLFTCVPPGFCRAGSVGPPHRERFFQIMIED